MFHDNKFRTAYDGREAEVSDATALHDFGPSLAVQAAKDECDINNIIDRFNATGQFTHLKDAPLQYADVSHLTDFRDAMDIVVQAQDLFMSLDAKLRARFGNDPAAYVDFLMNPANMDEAVKLGLASYPDSGEDLSTAPLAGDTASKASGAVEKSGKQRSAAPRASNVIPDGFKLVPVGGEGDD